MFTALIFLSFGCERFSFLRDPALARVRLRFLRESEMNAAIGPNATLQEKNQFIEKWVNHRVWYTAAKKNIRLNPGLREQLREYRRTLLVREYTDLTLHKDIIIGENEVLTYYDEHRDDFITPRRSVYVEMYTSKNKDAVADIIETLKKGDRPTLPGVRTLLARGDCVDVLDSGLFAKNTDSFVGPLFYAGEYYVFSVLERYADNTQLRPEHVREEIIQKLRSEAYVRNYHEKQKELKDRFNVKIFEITDK